MIKMSHFDLFQHKGLDLSQRDVLFLNVLTCRKKETGHPLPPTLTATAIKKKFTCQHISFWFISVKCISSHELNIISIFLDCKSLENTDYSFQIKTCGIERPFPARPHSLGLGNHLGIEQSWQELRSLGLLRPKPRCLTDSLCMHRTVSKANGWALKLAEAWFFFPRVPNTHKYPRSPSELQVFRTASHVLKCLNKGLGTRSGLTNSWAWIRNHWNSALFTICRPGSVWSAWLIPGTRVLFFPECC